MAKINEDTARRVGDAIRDYFNKNAITQQMAADKLGTSQAIVSARLTGSRPFGKNAAWKWCRAFGFEPSFLMTGEGELVKGAGVPLAEQERPGEQRAQGSGYFAKLCRDLMEQIIEKDRRICRLEEELKKERGDGNGTLQA